MMYMYNQFPTSGRERENRRERGGEEGEREREHKNFKCRVWVEGNKSWHSLSENMFVITCSF